MRIYHFPQVVDSDQELDDLVSETIYVVSENGRPSLVQFICPCGCGGYVDLPLRGSEARPGRGFWDLERPIPDLVSLHPSINSCCGAHYWLKNNRVEGLT